MLSNCIPVIFQYVLLIYCIPLVKDQSKFYDFFSLGFTPCKAGQPLKGMELQEKEAKKDLAMCISIKTFNWVNREQLNILKTFLKYLEF